MESGRGSRRCLSSRDAVGPAWAERPGLGVHHVLLSSSSTRHRGRQDLTGVLKFPSDEGQPLGEEVLLEEGRMCARARYLGATGADRPGANAESACTQSQAWGKKLNVSRHKRTYLAVLRERSCKTEEGASYRSATARPAGVVLQQREREPTRRKMHCNILVFFQAVGSNFCRASRLGPPSPQRSSSSFPPSPLPSVAVSGAKGAISGRLAICG